jgi:hypothetical protein
MTTNASDPASADAWLRALQAVLVAVGTYALVMVIRPELADRLVYSPLGFGSAAGGVPATATGYVGFVTAVTGAVLLGWVVLLLGLSRGPLARRDPWAWRAVVTSLLVWFVADTGMSLAVGYPTHAAFNVVFAVTLGVPLARLRPDSQPQAAPPEVAP